MGVVSLMIDSLFRARRRAVQKRYTFAKKLERVPLGIENSSVEHGASLRAQDDSRHGFTRERNAVKRKRRAARFMQNGFTNARGTKKTRAFLYA